MTQMPEYQYVVLKAVLSFIKNLQLDLWEIHKQGHKYIKEEKIVCKSQENDSMGDMTQGLGWAKSD